MAGQAQKKAAKAASSTARFSGLCILVANTLYCLWLAAQALQGASVRARRGHVCVSSTRLARGEAACVGLLKRHTQARSGGRRTRAGA